MLVLAVNFVSVFAYLFFQRATDSICWLQSCKTGCLAWWWSPSLLKPLLSQGHYLTNFASGNCVRHAEMCLCERERERESMQVCGIVPVVSPWSPGLHCYLRAVISEILQVITVWGMPKCECVRERAHVWSFVWRQLSLLIIVGFLCHVSSMCSVV